MTPEILKFLRATSTRELLALSFGREHWREGRLQRCCYTDYSLLFSHHHTALGFWDPSFYSSLLNHFTVLFETPFHCEPAPLILSFFTEHSCLYLIFTKTWLFLEDTAFPVQLAKWRLNRSLILYTPKGGGGRSVPTAHQTLFQRPWAKVLAIPLCHSLSFLISSIYYPPVTSLPFTTDSYPSLPLHP